MVLPLDQLFASTSLAVYTPEASLDFHTGGLTEEWLNSLRSGKQERQQAYFDEQLQPLLLLQIKHPEDEPFKADDPPDSIVDLLRHVQVSLEVTYISPVPSSSSPAESPRTPRLLATPRTGALAVPKSRAGRLHPSILPPNTPNPTPATGDNDRKYTTAEGKPLLAQIWGANTTSDSLEKFALLWSESENSWMAVYYMAFAVSCIKLSFNNPLICLTISATLREKPLATTSTHPLNQFFAEKNPLFTSASDSLSKDEDVGESDVNLLDGLEEVNLLEGLLAGPTFGKPHSDLNLPSTRLGTESRQKMFLLPPLLPDSPTQISPSPMTAVRKAHHTLRKSYRKTLQTASGFRVRMRTVFVPFVILPETDGNVEGVEEEKKQLARQEAGSAENSVVLCVEIENYGDMGQEAGFLVENVEVSIAGEGVHATLIGWGDEGFAPNAAKQIFPLKLGRSAQYNLLYAVSFLRSPEELYAFSFARNSSNPSTNNIHRAVTINVIGKPYIPTTSSSSKILIPNFDDVTYPTQSFSSQWNCVLDLSAKPSSLSDVPSDSLDQSTPNVLPQPASPFPAYSSYSNTPKRPLLVLPSASTSVYSATAGINKLLPTLDTDFATHRTLKILTPSKLPFRRKTDGGRDESPVGTSRPISLGHVSPNSVTYRSPTTYGTPPPPLPPLPMSIPSHLQETEDGPSIVDTPSTPAFPPFPPKSTLPPTPTSQRPVSMLQGNAAGPSVEIKRARNSMVEQQQQHNVLPATPLPFVSGRTGDQKLVAKLQESSNSGESVVVSVGLHPLHGGGGESEEVYYLGQGKIYPLQVFTLDIFVLNQSLWIRRLEITCPERRRRKRGGSEMGVFEGGTEAMKKMGYPGILPLESRVRIGPLRPLACQSVRMDFLAVSPGVHSVDVLTLTDIETGFCVNLRSVIDVVVHDPSD